MSCVAALCAGRVASKNIGYLADVPLSVCAILTATPRRKERGSLDRRVRAPGSSMGRGVFTQKELLAPLHSTCRTLWLEGRWGSSTSTDTLTFATLALFFLLEMGGTTV